ncbi:MAG: alpha-amylase family glycosyl hydrolase [Angustibacter sp.]
MPDDAIPDHVAPRPATPWWSSCVGYEVYLSSFQDDDGDGLGDLPGATRRLDHLAWLGVDLVWLTPFYPSPLRDQGYDVADYTAVDQRFGDLADLDRFVARAHELGLRVVVDLVANHTSDQHPWFLESRGAAGSPRRDWYVWRDGRDGGQQPPNNWVSAFGGTAWTFDPASRQWWLHRFLPEQPDLNWRNPAVVDAVTGVVDFWMRRGVDGFRVDAAQLFATHPDLPDNPPRPVPPPRPVTGRSPDWDRYEHRYDEDWPDALEAHRALGRAARAHGGVLLGEVYLAEPARLRRYVEGGDAFDLVFFFGLVESGWDPAHLVAAVRDALVLGPHVAWVLSSHDSVRAVSRFSGGADRSGTDSSSTGGGQAGGGGTVVEDGEVDRGRARAFALHTLLCCLPGVPFLYQGEELALTDGVVPPDRVRDPIALAGEPASGRDGARTPVPWEPGAGLGFTTASTGWLPDGGRAEADTVAWQRAEPASWLHRYRELIAVRRRYPQLREAPVEWLDDDPRSLSVRRGSLLLQANLTDEPGAGEVVGTPVFSTPGALDTGRLRPAGVVLTTIDPTTMTEADQR